MIFIKKDGEIAGWSTSDSIGIDIDGEPAEARWVEVDGDTKGYFKKPKDYKIKKEKVKYKDKKGKIKEKDVYKFNKKSKD